MTCTVVAPEVASFRDDLELLDACLGRLCGAPVDRLSGAGQAEVLGQIARAQSRLQAVKLRVLAEADRADTARASGASDTTAWAARLSRDDAANTHRDVRLAQGLNRRAVTQRALAQGDLTARHAAVIVEADRQLPAQVSVEQRIEVETALVEKARVLSPARLRRVARRAIEVIEVDVTVVDAHEDQLVADEESRAYERTVFSLHDNHDGTVTGRFVVPALQGHLLRKILQEMTAPRRARMGASSAQVGEVGGRVGPDHARGAAFCELLEHLPTDRLHTKTAATIVVTLAEDALVERVRRVGFLDTGAEISAGQARRLACGAGLLPAVLGRASIPLDLGRSERLFSETQRVALGLGHETCAGQGCERPFAWCELHHLIPWSRGGPHRSVQRSPAVLVPPPPHPRRWISPPSTCRWHHHLPPPDLAAS